MQAWRAALQALAAKVNHYVNAYLAHSCIIIL
jgi:hypothetical protein